MSADPGYPTQPYPEAPPKRSTIHYRLVSDEDEWIKHISLLAAMILGVGTKANEVEIGRAVWIANEILKVAKEYKHEPERPN